MTGYNATTTGNATENGWGPMVQVALEQAQARRQRIVVDPLVSRLLPPALRLLLRIAGTYPIRVALTGMFDRTAPGVRGGVLCRKRYIEDRLAECAPSLQSVVILGAGMDTLAYRLTALDHLAVYEVDMPGTIASKRVALRRAFGQAQPRAKLASVNFDRQDAGEALRAAGYQPDGATFFVWEGVTQYLTEPAVHRVLTAIRPMHRESRLIFTYIRRDFIDGRNLYGLELLYRQTRVRRSLWHFGLEPDTVAAFLEPYGWRVVEQVGDKEYEERYLRPIGRALPVMAVERAVLARAQ